MSAAPARHLPGLLLALASAATGQEEPPTFARDVAPIVYEHCTPCHRPGETTPFVLEGYEDVRKRSEQVALVVGRRLMPPWLPTEGDFADDRRLSAEDVATILRWVEAGAPRGDAALEPAPPVFPTGWQLGEPELVVTAPEELHVPADGPDLFRNLVIPLELERPVLVEAVEIRPGSPAVHHAILQVDDTRGARRLDAEDEEPGFPGMSMGLSHPPGGHFIAWTPGKRARRSPEGWAFPLEPGEDLVLQVHLTPTGKPETVRPALGFHLTDVPVRVRPQTVVLHSEDIDIPPGERDHVVRDDLTLPVPVTLHSLYPHAHHLCRSMRGTATLPDGRERLLFAIDRWSFDWQDDYRLRIPLELPTGTRLSFEYHYDNSADNPANPSSPPRRVTFGQGSTDEMATLTLTVTLADEAHRATLAEASAKRDTEKRPWDWAAWLDLAVARREGARLKEAMAALDEALRLKPDYALALTELGICRQLSGDPDGAAEAYRESLRADPEESVAHMRLGEILGRSGETREAIEHFRHALTVYPDMAPLQNNLATALLIDGQLAEAELHYRRAVELDPEYFNAWLNLGRTLSLLGRTEEARAALQRADALWPGNPAVRELLDGLEH